MDSGGSVELLVYKGRCSPHKASTSFVGPLSDNARMTDARMLAARLADLLRRERAEMAEFLLLLADFDKQRGWLELGYSSLFYFLHRELGLSKGCAYYRKTAAELIQRFPEVVEPLRDGRLCITSIVHVAKVLTFENCDDVLPRFFQRSKREARAVAAAIQPMAAPHRDVVTAARPTPAGLMTAAPDSARANVPVHAAVHPDEPAGAVHPDEPNGRRSSGQHPGALVQPVEPVGPAGGGVAARPQPGAARADSAEPLTADLSRLHVTVSKRFLHKLEEARAALSHAQPRATTEDVLEAALDLLLKRHYSRRGIVEKPRKRGEAGNPPKQGANLARPAAVSGTIPTSLSGSAKPADESTTGRPDRSPVLPAGVKRQVWTRDGGRCQWPLESGGTCHSPLRVEFDHIIPRAFGGTSTPENLRLLCRFHNDLAARRAFGAAWMNQFTQDPGGGPEKKV